MYKGIINFKLFFKLIGNVLLIITGGFLVCLVVATIYHENLSPFLYSAAITGGVGAVFKFFTRGKIISGNITRRDAYFVVALAWIFLGLAGSLPYLFSSSMSNFTDAFFESVSGFTTTGSSILTDIEVLTKSVLFWRSLTHWIGGIGIIVLVIIIMPGLMSGGYQLFSMESSLQEKFSPRTRTVGKRLLLIYLGLTFAEVIFLLLGKMNLFDSLCHSFGTVATGGFSPKNSSIAEYSPYIQYVIMIFMLLAGVNFVVHYYIIKGSFKKVVANEELRLYLLFVFLIGTFIGVMLFIKTDRSFEESLRESFFQVISIITCTGFASADYLLWPRALWMIIFFSMFLGGSTGSTAGGIKIVRHLIVFKNVRRQFLHMINPKAVLPVILNKKAISESTNASVLNFVGLYFIVFIAGSIALVFSGVDLQSSLGSAATCMAGIGPGLGTVGPVSNFAHLPELAKHILILLMILGRLEIYTVLILFSRQFWRKY